jgi:hypothetical protein
MTPDEQKERDGLISYLEGPAGEYWSREKHYHPQSFDPEGRGDQGWIRYQASYTLSTYAYGFMSVKLDNEYTDAWEGSTTSFRPLVQARIRPMTHSDSLADGTPLLFAPSPDLAASYPERVCALS